MRIGIVGNGFMGWAGGSDFLRNFAGSLIAADPKAELHFLFPISGPKLLLRRTLRKVKNGLTSALGGKYEAARAPSLDHLKELVHSLGRQATFHPIDYGESALRSAAKEHGLEVLLPSAIPLMRQEVPWIGYLPDLQHKHYPQFFSSGEIARRNRDFQFMLNEAEKVIVNANAVADDISTFFAKAKAKILVLPFSACPEEEWLATRPVAKEKFGIKSPYFIICNQFWKHKDHLVAWKAFARLLKVNPQIDLVCTGETQDYRDPDYFSFLERNAEILGIKNNLRILGLLPKIEQISLLRSSLGLIQPTLFEGGPGGGAVFDAVALGVPSIVSDIKVNRELKDSSIRFFEAQNDESLFLGMMDVLSSRESPSLKTKGELLAAGYERRKTCGRYILDSIRES